MNEESKKRLCEAAKTWDGVNFALIVSDGLSATAANENALETVSELVKQLPPDKWEISPIMIIPFARVKIQDYIGQILGGKALVSSDRREAWVGVARQPERVFYI